MHHAVAKCPVCSGPLHPTEIACDTCDIRIAGSFEASRFARLTPEQLGFLELFLRSRGNLSATADELDISFPTVTRRLDAILAALDLSAGDCGQQPEPTVDTRDIDRARILAMLDTGEITADEATRQLREL